MRPPALGLARLLLGEVQSFLLQRDRQNLTLTGLHGKAGRHRFSPQVSLQSSLLRIGGKAPRWVFKLRTN